LRAAQWRYERVRRGAQGRSISPAAYARLQLSTRSVGEAAAAVLGAERRPIERAPARKPGGAGRVRKKSPAEAGHKVIGSSSSTNCGPASQPLLSGRSETRAQNCRQARSKNVEPRGWFGQARGLDRKSPARKRGFFVRRQGCQPGALAKRRSAHPPPSTARLAVGCCVGSAEKGPPKRGKLGGDACRPTPSSAHEGQSRSWAPEFGGKPRQNVEPSRWLCISACSPARDQAQLPSLGN
jgi:hypothetical protein